jgi:TIR domain
MMNTVVSNKKLDESTYTKTFHDVFISYSRKDKEFVHKLSDALVASNHTIWLDTRDIPYTADWQEEIYRNIVTANNVLCVLSPAFIQSPHCRDEMAYATQVGKRLVPIEIHDINRLELSEHQELAPLNKIQNIPFQGSNDFDHAFKKLVVSLDTDLDYIQKQRQWGVRALEWENKGRNNSYVLRGQELEEAEHWRDNAIADKKEPILTPLQIQYIALSRRVTRRRQRSMISLGGAIAVVIVVALVVVLVLQNALLRSLPVSVTNMNDAGPGSLRDAINNAHSGDAITFQKTLTGTIYLKHGELLINKNLTISGPDTFLAISGMNKGRVFHIAKGTFVTLSKLTIDNGHTNGSQVGEDGAGIKNEGSLVVTSCMIVDNTTSYHAGSNDSAFGSGGGIDNLGTLQLVNSNVSRNSAYEGGGVENFGLLNVITSTISQNVAFNGGGISIVLGQAIISSSTISDNTAYNLGGGLISGSSKGGTFILNTSTISGNKAVSGGGIFDIGNDSMFNSTISGNSSSEGGGGIDGGYQDDIIYTTIYDNRAKNRGGGGINGMQISLWVSIVAGNSANSGPDILGNAFILGPNLIQNTSGLTPVLQADNPSIISKPADLGPLQNNGGPTQTDALLPGSPAIDQIPYQDTQAALCGPTHPTDQRGIPRPQGRSCDLGAYEYVSSR